jgi:hypothetical protein
VPILTTVFIGGIPSDREADGFRKQLDEWGLQGTYDLFFMPARDAGAVGSKSRAPRVAIVNFVDSRYVALCVWLFQEQPYEGVVSMAPIQGFEENLSYYGRMAAASDGPAPVVVPEPTPCEWAMCSVEALVAGMQLVSLSGWEEAAMAEPPARGQFLKTKMCGYFKKNMCRFGASCPFAHSKEEMQEAPNLAKTRLCCNFLRGRCKDTACKYAHGYRELRSTDRFYKTEMCRWFSLGTCRAGAQCRYAHSREELRSTEDGYGNSYGTGGCLALIPNECVWGYVPMLVEDPNASEFSSGTAFEGDALAEFGAAGVEGDAQMHTHASGDQSLVEARPAIDLSQFEEDMLVVRNRRTFVEVARAVESDLEVPPLRRSFSDGDLAAYKEAVELQINNEEW